MTDLTPLDLDAPRCADCPIRGACHLNCPARAVDPDALHVHLWEVRSWHSDFPERHGGTATLACAACSASVEVTPWATSHLDLNEARSALCDAADEVERLRANGNGYLQRAHAAEAVIERMRCAHCGEVGCDWIGDIRKARAEKAEAQVAAVLALCDQADARLGQGNSLTPTAVRAAVDGAS